MGAVHLDFLYSYRIQQDLLYLGFRIITKKLCNQQNIYDPSTFCLSKQV